MTYTYTCKRCGAQIYYRDQTCMASPGCQIIAYEARAAHHRQIADMHQRSIQQLEEKIHALKLQAGGTVPDGAGDQGEPRIDQELGTNGHLGG